MILSFLMVLLFAVSGFACSNSPTDKTEPDDPTTPTNPAEPTEEASLSSLNSALSKDEFQISGTGMDTDNYGLSDPTQVGVDQERFNNEVLYPIPADSEFDEDAIFEVPSDANIDGLNRILSQAKAKNAEGKPVKLKFASGDFLLDAKYTSYSGDRYGNAYTVMIQGFDGIYLEGNDTTFLIDVKNLDHTDLLNDKKAGADRAWPGGIAVRDCKNFYMQGINLDYEFLPYFTATVIDSDENAETIDLEIDPEFRNDIISNAGEVQITSYIEINPYTNAPDAEGNVGYVGEVIHHELDTTITDNKLTIQWLDYTEYQKPKNGTKVNLTFVNHAINGISFEDGENYHVESCNIYGTPSMGYTAKNIKNLYMNRANLKFKDDTRHMTSTADGMHFLMITGECKVTNSLIEGSHDDALNINQERYLTVESANLLSDTLVLKNEFTGSLYLPEVGDEYEIYNDDVSVATTVEVLSAEIKGSVIEIKCKGGDLSKVRRGQRALNVSSFPEFLFENNIIRNKRSRGLLIQVRNATIRNCTFLNISHTTMHIYTEIAYLCEAGLPKHVTVENCKIINNDYISRTGNIVLSAQGKGNFTGMPASSEALQDINIRNNYFYNNATCAVDMGSASNSAIENNLFYNNARIYLNPEYEGEDTDISTHCTLLFNNSSDLSVTGNYNYYDLGHEQYIACRVAGTTSPKDIDVTQNFNLSYTGKAEALKPTEVAKLEAAPTIDGDLSDWADSGTDIAMDYAFRLDVGVEPLPDGDNFRINTAKIGWTDEGLFMAFDITDDELIWAPEAGFWADDVLEIFITGEVGANMDIAALKEDGATMQIGIGSPYKLTLSSVRTSTGIVRDNWQYEFVIDSDGYVVEFMIPFEYAGNLKSYIEEQSDIGISVVCHNRQSNVANKLCIGNVPNNMETGKYNSAKMPLFRFV